MKYIREYYGVPAKRGAVLMFMNEKYRITSSKGPYLCVTSLSGERLIIHPTWKVKYL